MKRFYTCKHQKEATSPCSVVKKDGKMQNTVLNIPLIATNAANELKKEVGKPLRQRGRQKW